MIQTILFAVPPRRWRKYLAESIAGSLGAPSKMPGRSWGISPKLCKVGQALAKIPGSTCEKCYAMRDNYTYPSVKTAHARRAAPLACRLLAGAMPWSI